MLTGTRGTNTCYGEREAIAEKKVTFVGIKYTTAGSYRNQDTERIDGQFLGEPEEMLGTLFCLHHATNLNLLDRLQCDYVR